MRSTEIEMTDTAFTLGSEWILKTMVAMAKADGDLDRDEVDLIQRLYRDHAKEDVETDEIERIAEDDIRSDFYASLAQAGKRLDEHSKEEIVRCAYLVLLADGEIAGAERKTLQEIAAALKIPEIHFGAILEDLSIWMAAQRAAGKAAI
ncbi:Tellurite resistance protein TerB [Methyloligella halotolerans]|uniref:Tellurite resistance protein TerB n=1 Tax=Methyloligella halotolerans TaxID=1177755 RepID=A0A1E2S400_9HYPH|nr:TerB family tellurite resistance protein [Methyloligella halotolerans]ODA69055.1 Tellurite resistance protein TerB [Methyloligella halotolerans]